MPTETEKLVPDRRVSLDGTLLGPDEAARISRITVDLSDGVFNECRIVFTDPDLSLISGQKLMGGVAVMVELGYTGKLKPVFEGEIVSVEPRFTRDKPASVVVRALEQIHRLALTPKTRAFNDVNPTQVLTQVAREHGLSASGPSGGTNGHFLQPNITDYALLTKIAARTGHRVALDGRKLMLAPPPSMGTLDVLPDDGLLRLKVALRTTEQVPKVTVRGWDWKQQKEIEGSATPQGEAADGWNAAKSMGRTALVLEGVPVADRSEAESIAKATLARITEKYAVATGTMKGSPELLPGKVIALDKHGELLDGQYRLTTARHEFDKKGYRVEFEATRIAKKKTVAKFKAPPKQKDVETTFIEAGLKDGAGKPMTGVRVTLEVSGDEPKELYTDATGSVKLQNVKKGASYSITFHDEDDVGADDEATGKKGKSRGATQQKKPGEKETAAEMAARLKRTGAGEAVYEARVEVLVDPAAKESKDDKYKLFSSDKAYSKVLTSADDTGEAPQKTSLVFEELLPGKKYSLEVDPGAEGEPYLVFENLGFSKLATEADPNAKPKAKPGEKKLGE